MKISIITVCYNSSATIRDTLRSVANQKNKNIEHILIDGASTDDTLKIIEHFDSVTKLVSEPDKGIYDAMNKGIALTVGDVIGTLNADDFYADDTVLTEVAKVFLDPKVEACYADLVYVRQDNVSKVVRFWKSRDYEPGLFKSGWMPAHPTFFVRKSVYEKYGLFNLDYKIAADFELLFRFIEKNKINTRYLPKVLVKMRMGGTTNKNFSNIFLQNKEIVATLKNVYPNFSIYQFLIRKVLNRAKQFICRP